MSLCETFDSDNEYRLGPVLQFAKLLNLGVAEPGPDVPPQEAEIL